uniref:RNA-directed RNA polymerase L n=7 Tax=unclassified Phlebovirus TaxID=327794 RepID=A0A7S8IWW3_9VIRU|nr:RNA-dependent RNA-polymerase [Kharabali tick phlebovirus]
MNSTDKLASLKTLALRTDYEEGSDLFIPQRGFYEIATETLPVPRHKVTRQGKQINIEFDTESLGAAGGSSIVETPEHSISLEASNTFIHDFTFHHLADKTDMRFSAHFPRVNDDFDNHTPDVILRDIHGRYAVIEFATCRQPDYRVMQHMYENKIGKYEPACRSRSDSDHKITLFCIVVSENHIITNMELSDIDARELCLRFNTAIDVYAYMTAKDIVPMLTEGETTSTGASVQLAFQDIDFNWSVTESKFKPFSKELYDSWFTPPDTDYVKKVVKHCMEKTNELLKNEHIMPGCSNKGERLAMNGIKAHEAVLQYTKDYHAKGKRFRGIHAQKSTIPIPALVPALSEKPGVDLKPALSKPSIFPQTKDPVGTLWHEIFLKLARGDIKRPEEFQEMEEKFLKGDATKDEEHTAKALRSSFHRVKIPTHSDDATELAKFGIEGKRHRNDPAVKENRAEKKKGFHLYTDISGLEKFLEESPTRITEHNLYHAPKFINEILKANKSALDAHGFKNSRLGTLRQVEGFWSSPIMRWATMVSTIGIELAIANKQHCKTGEFIVKKLRDYDVFLLIKPTNSTGPMFVSLAWHESDAKAYITNTGVFKRFHCQGGWCWTDFHSFKAAKISTLVKAASRVNNLYWFWREQYNLRPWLSASGEQELKSVVKMLKVSMMCMFEDKARTEELFTNFRYIMLEGFVSEPCLPKPYKMIEKLPEVARTHLQVWLIKKTLSTIESISIDPWRATSDEGKMKWSNLFNPFTHEKVEDPYRMINLFYIGYLKNKDESGEKNSTPALIRKIVKLEDQHPGRYDYLGKGDPPLGDMRTHEYSSSFQKHVCESALNILKATWGQSVEQTIHMDILNAFGNLTLDRVSTLKASSAFDETWYKSDGSKQYHRKKVVENMQKFIKPENTHVHHVLKDCLETIEKRGCMHIDIFKKNQHGGLREIYVLGPEERIIQLGLETIARQVCRRFKSETLTNPDQKTRIPETHGRRARACQTSDNLSGKIETVGTSDDLKTFNQTQHTTKLAMTLVKFTKKELHPFIIRACSLFMHKRIKLDDDLMQIIIKNAELKTSDETLSTLHKAYRGMIDPPPRWARSGLSFIETETGMMQGILHFLSSLHHTCLQEWFRVFCNLQLSSALGKKRSGVLVDVLQSSDDSAVLISYPAMNEQQIKRCRLITAQLLHMKKFLGEFLALYPSVKCTTNTINVLEFNSEFFFHNDHVRPTLKWIIACDQISEQEAIVSRQEEMSSALTGVLEGGGSISLCHLCQYGQSLLHYSLIGAGVSFLFLRFLQEALVFKDPSLGFFLMDHPFGSGLTGFKYNLWNQIRGSNLAAVYKLFLTTVKEDQQPEEKVRTYKSLETTTCGALASSVIVRFGNRANWQALKSRCSVPEDWETEMDENPEMLYRQAKTTREVKLKIAEKLHAPGVSASLSRGDQITKIISSSIYILSRNVVCEGTTWMDSSNTVLGNKKPLLRLIMERNKIPLENFSQLDDEELKTLFPMHAEYCHLKDVLADHMTIDGGPIMTQRQTVQTRVVVIQKEETTRARPEDVLTDIWFSFKRSGLTRPVLEQAFRDMQQNIPWLRNTVEESLQRSPFLHQHQLRNFISRMDYEGRVVRLVGAPLKAKTETNIATVVTKNFFPQWQLSFSYDRQAWKSTRLVVGLKHFCTLLCAGPYTDAKKMDLLTSTFKDYPSLSTIVGAGKSRTNTLALLQRFVKMSPEEVSGFHQEMRRANCGIIGGFSRAQRSKQRGGKVEYYGEGVWEGTVNGHAVEIYIDSYKGRTHLKEVRVSTDEFARLQLCPFIRQWCKDMDVLNTQKIKQKGANFILHNFELYTYGEGCPVYTSLSRPMGPDIPYESMRLTVEGSCIALIHHASYQRRVKILSYNCRATDVSEYAAGALMENMMRFEYFRSEPTHSWMWLRSMNHQTLMVHKKAFSDPAKMGALDKHRYREIIADSTVCLMNQRGYTLHDISPSSISTAEEEAALALLWDHDVMDSLGPLMQQHDLRQLLGIGGGFDISQPVSEEVEQDGGIVLGQFDGVNPEDIDISDNIDAEVFGELEFQVSSRSRFRHPQLVANTIDEVIKDKLTALDISTLLERRTVIKGKEEAAYFLMWLLNREQENITVITHREEMWDEGVRVSEAKSEEDIIG